MRTSIRVIGVSGVLFALAACGGGGGGPSNTGSGGGGGTGGGTDTTPPSVVTTTPVDTTAGVAFNAVISATLSEVIDPATVSSNSLSVRQGATLISGSAVVSGSTVTFRPENALRSGLTYTATLDAGVTDLAGNALGTNFSWQFTVADYNVAFVTSVSGNGNLSSWADANGKTGLAAGDAICQARAAAAGLADPTGFKAWLSDSNDDAYCRIQNLTGKRSNNCGQATLPAAAGPWVRTDGYAFAGPLSELFGNADVYTPIRFDEFGTLVTQPFYFYFTGTGSDGSVQSLQFQVPVIATCADWTTNMLSQDLWWVGGDSAMTDIFWTSWVSASCDQSRALLCMHTGTGPALPTLVPTGKKIFITSTGGSGNLGSWAEANGESGLAAGDAICQARAAAAGLANAATFKAWLSDSGTDAKDRISSDGPWVRLDGVPVATNKADLIDGSLFTSINVDETGSHGLVGYPALTGTTDAGIKATDNCNDWTDGTAGFSAISGRAQEAGSGWSGSSSSLKCDYQYFRLYCFED